MSRETDSLIAYLKAANVPFIVTDLSTRGVHASTSLHYAEGTGGVGLAVNLAFRRGAGTSTKRELLAIWKVFEPLAKAGRLAELYYSEAETCVFRGKYQPWARLPLATRNVIQNAHFAHVHVAVNKGVILEVPKPKPVEVPTSKEDDDMPKWADEYRWPNGDVVQVYPNGDIKCFGAKFSGSMNDLRDDAKTVFKPGAGNDAVSVRPLVASDSHAGYVIGLSSGHEFGMSFRPEHRKFYK